MRLKLKIVNPQYIPARSSLLRNSEKRKPKYSPTINKWLSGDLGGAGTISIAQNGIWTYHDWEGNYVSYPNGYPDFRNAQKKPVVIQEVELEEFIDYEIDFPKADAKAKEKGKPRNKLLNTWHHHQDCKTMQEISSEFHHRYTHTGGLSISRNRKRGK